MEIHNMMKRIITIVTIFLTLLSSNSIKAQSFEEQLRKAEAIKAQYGETDDRYLDALSSAIQVAFNEEKAEEANKYRLIHADIVKGKYGENSFEYAEDMWRLGNVSSFKGDAYRYNCYKAAQKSLEAIGAQDSFIYADLFWQYFWYFNDTQKWLQAALNLNKYIAYAKPWINKEWKGNVLNEMSLVNAYYCLGLTYHVQLQNYTSSTEAFKNCISILEENKFENDFRDLWTAYQGIWLGYENLGNYEESVKWHLHSLAVAERLRGDTSEEYFSELTALRNCYFSFNDYESAEKTILRILSQIEIRDKKMGVSCVTDSLYVNEYRNLSSISVITKNYPKVIQYGSRLSEIYKERGEEGTDKYLSLLDDLILAYHNTNNFLEEYELFPHFEDLAKRHNLINTEDYWSYLSLKSEALTFLYKVDEHEKTVQEWEALTTKLYGKNSRQALLYAYQIANQHESLDQHTEAKAGIDNCFRIIEAGECSFENKADSILILAGLHNLEGLAYNSSNPERAERALLAAIEENRLIGRNDYAPQLNLGLLYYQQKRDFKRAQEYFEQARQSLENIGDNYSIQYITVLNDLGLCYHDLGMNSLAITIFDLASQTVLANYGKQHVMYGTTEQNKSMFYITITDYPKAIASCKEAMECFRQVFGEESERYAACLQNLGLMYQYQGDYAASKEILQKAIPILERLNSPYCIYAYINMLSVYAFEKDGDKLANLADIAEAKLKENRWEETDVAASLYGSIGYAMAINGLPGGKPYLGYALNLLEKAGGKASIQYYTGLLFFGLSSFLDQSQSEEMIPILTESYKNLYLNNAAFFNSDERESLISGPRFSQTKNVLFSSRLEGEYDTSLYDFLLFNKGLLLGTSISYAKAIYNSNNDELIAAFDKLRRLNRYLNGEIGSGSNGISLDEARTQASALEREITAFLRQNEDYTDELNYTYSDVNQSIGDNDLAVEFVEYLDYSDNTTYYAALLAKREWSKPKYIKLCGIDELETISSLSPSRLYGETADSEKAFNLIWAPLASYLNKVKTIYFSPAGHLNRLAIEHLYNGKNRLEDNYNVVRLSSTRELCGKKAQYKYSNAVLYGGLSYDEDDATMIAESRKIHGERSLQFEVFRGNDNTGTRRGWAYLPGTLEEVRQISSLILKSQIKCDVYSSEKGNEESFKALSGNSFGILHIATHGFFLTESEAEKNNYIASNPFSSQRVGTEVSPLQRSGLLLAGGNKAWKGEPVPEGVEDGVLTAAEIASLDFNRCDIVVLSACETGLGEITDEGVLGLQRAFKNSGVNTIIMSLWDVDDHATSLMMQSFYRNLMSGKSKRVSFSSAQNEVKKEYSDPRYWAAFIMLD